MSAIDHITMEKMDAVTLDGIRRVLVDRETAMITRVREIEKIKPEDRGPGRELLLKQCREQFDRISSQIFKLDRHMIKRFGADSRECGLRDVYERAGV